MKSLGERVATIAKQDAVTVLKYEQLLEAIATLSNDCPGHVLYFRGQKNDYLNSAGSTSIYPSIYRGRLTEAEIRTRFQLLNLSCKSLLDKLKEQDVIGYSDIERRVLIQWSIIQHYGICESPLLDITHSLSVACSFASGHDYDDSDCYLYVLAMPYLTNRISINSEEDVILIRLLGITPPAAKRPYYQEGYLVGTADITDKYTSKDELDLNSRLVGKFVFKNSERFWGSNFRKLGKDFIYPSDDIFCKIADEVQNERKRGFSYATEGDFLRIWNEIEEILRNQSQERSYNIIHQYNSFIAKHETSSLSSSAFDGIRRFRNKLVHDTKAVNEKELSKYYNEILSFYERIKHNNVP